MFRLVHIVLTNFFYESDGKIKKTLEVNQHNSKIIINPI